MKYESNHLLHYGIQGQKWGVRRFQYDNGSYTPEGKERYGRGQASDGRTRGFFANKKREIQFELDKKNIEKDFDSSINAHRDIADRILDNGNRLVDQANALSESYSKYLNNMTFTDRNKENVWDGLLYDFGKDGTDDEELYELGVRDRIYEEVWSSLENDLPKKLQKEREAFNRSLDQYWKDVGTISDPVLSKYKDKYTKELKNEKSWDQVDVELNKLRGDKLGTAFIGYLSRHFDDYWIGDTPAFYDAVERLENEFPFEEYEKRRLARK